MKTPMIDMMEKSRFDNLFTPEHAVHTLIKYIPENKTIWECTDPGCSNIAKVLREYGHDVVSTDIQTGFDFLNDKPAFDYDLIISNPPYSLKNKFIKRCYDLQKPFILLLPLTTLEGIERGEMFRKNGISVIVLDRRLDFTGKGANWFATAWFCWNVIPNNSLVFEQI